MTMLLSLAILSGFLRISAGQCVFEHDLGQTYIVEQTYDNAERLEFQYTCQKTKFNEEDRDFFYYRLESCKASNISYAPGDTWRQGPFLYECFFRVTQEEGSVSEVRHVGCFLKDFLIKKGDEALLDNYRFACDDLGLHPVSCISTKEGLEMRPGDVIVYGLDKYNCSQSQNGLSLQESTETKECKLSGKVAVVYLIDTSESVKEVLHKNIVLPAVAAELESLPAGYKIRLATYSTDWVSHGDWVTLSESNRDEVNKRVLDLPFLGEGTKTAGALRKTVGLFKGIGDDYSKIIVLVTDGEARDVEEIPAAAREMAANSINVISVGIGEEINEQELARYGYTIVRLDNLEGLKTALKAGEVRCKIFERTEKVTFATDQCKKWAREDIPMESKFLSPCPATQNAAASDIGMKKDPSCSDNAPAGDDSQNGWRNCKYNRGASTCYHSKVVGIRYGGSTGEIFRSRNQCCYDGNGNLIRESEKGAGTAQKASRLLGHIVSDVQPAEFCREAGMWEVYLEHRPVGEIAK